MHRFVVVSAALTCAAGCSDRGEMIGRTRLHLEAYCQATVIGTGVVDVETDYLPSVVTCENGAASLEALKAQAVAARSYLYYRLDRTGDIGDGTGDQVYSCGRPPTANAIAAVEATAGIVLQYQGTQVAAFYVAGAKQQPPDCMGGTDDPTNTERFVTYNQGLSGDDITQTTLGLVNPTNRANRGCKSQNGADCLSDNGWLYPEILRFYYGEDIEMVQSEGSCIAAGEADAGITGVVDGGQDARGGGTATGNEVSGGCSGGGPGRVPTGLLLLVLASFAMRRRRAF